MEVTSDASDSMGGNAAATIIAAAAGAGETVHPDQAQRDELAARLIRFKIACKAGCSAEVLGTAPRRERGRGQFFSTSDESRAIKQRHIDAADDRQKRKVVEKPKERENRVQRDNREYIAGSSGSSLPHGSRNGIQGWSWYRDPW